MDLEREKAIYRIIDQVYAPLPELREAYLRAECGDDEALFARLQALVAADAEDEAEVERRAGRSLNALIEDVADGDGLQQDLQSYDWYRRIYGPLEEGATVGPYRIQKKISEGGMGLVFLAGRDDDFHMKVALKLIKPAMVTEETLGRFHRERQILANLRHRNIAQLFDGGTSDAGLPYLAMEYVDGEPIDQYCRRRRLSLRRRLVLFGKVCDAVSYAHQNLVIHRDLKPANILVTEEGEPKLLDFGIAGLVDPDSPKARLRTTRPFMTPEFAAPEQFRGGHLTVASDIYALGVILYYLLTDSLPYAFDHQRPGDYLQIIEGMAPVKPSLRTTKNVGEHTEIHPGELRFRRRKLLAGDLDSIVLHALQKEPRERYPSVEQFVDDIRLHLEGMPVRVRSATWSYRLGKFVARNHLVLTTAATFVLLLAGFAFSSVYQYRQTLVEKEQAQRVTEILMSLFEITDPSWSRGETLTAKTFLDESTVKIKEELQQQPRAYTRLTGSMGRVYAKIGFHDEARALLEESLAGYARLAPAPDDQIETLHDLAQLLVTAGEQLRAEALAREASVMMKAHGRDKDPLLRAKVQAELGWMLVCNGAFDEAEPLIREALRYQREFAPETPELATMLGYLGRLYLGKGLPEKADQPLYEALALRSRLLGGTHPQMAEILHDLSLLMAARGDRRAAKRMSREALVMRRRLFGDQHYLVAANLADLARIFAEGGETAEAGVVYRDALALQLRLFEDHHPAVLRSRFELGRLAVAEGKGDAGVYFEELTRALREHPVQAPFQTAGIMKGYADLLAGEAAADRGAIAVQWYRRALQEYQRVVPSRHPRVVETNLALAETLRREGLYEEAAEVLRRLNETAQKFPEIFRERKVLLDGLTKRLDADWRRVKEVAR
ncbi:serine/threonine-protein kinase [Acanthopleuribacter pedis]|uniref:Tetratricopeptide repeat protein n=1 Tax=Acanthopleuribacter pedis TaxID=442870 RepID=A0A8J7Q4K5_9BACT|nr:tetratricopeptide repeat protein [Acanthopleuribacter pedis]MBO1320482.1 tetratricopeptide repeat protein [Acanthopleuribacter pedis]